MYDRDVFIEMISHLARWTRGTVEGISQEALDWQPDAQANGIGVTVWHVSRWIDFLTVRMLYDRPAAEEIWFTDGWAARTGYDPRGLGWGGLGALTGFSVAEMKQVPSLTADDHLRYLDAVCAALIAAVRALPAGAMHQPAPGLRGVRNDHWTVYEWLLIPLLGSFGHVGEIQALKALHARSAAVAS
jgi:hypothetical protein